MTMCLRINTPPQQINSPIITMMHSVMHTLASTSTQAHVGVGACVLGLGHLRFRGFVSSSVLSPGTLTVHHLNFDLTFLSSSVFTFVLFLSVLPDFVPLYKRLIIISPHRFLHFPLRTFHFLCSVFTFQ